MGRIGEQRQLVILEARRLPVVGSVKIDMDRPVVLEESQELSLQLGMICSFSIPIITICALIVLMIFLSLLNIIFWWLPFFRICFPFPKKAS